MHYVRWWKCFRENKVGRRGVHSWGLVTILNMAVRDVLSEQAAFEQSFKGAEGAGQWLPEERTFQAKRRPCVKALGAWLRDSEEPVHPEQRTWEMVEVRAER